MYAEFKQFRWSMKGSMCRQRATNAFRNAVKGQREMHLKKHLGTALITGASSAIGAVYADDLARRGYDLILVARNRSRLEGIASCLRHLRSISVETDPADLTQLVDLRRVEQRLLANHRAVLDDLLASGWQRLDEPIRIPAWPNWPS